ncbi:heme A synthase [Haloferax sp. MBLA0077]|uniref:Heme A synthase n=3 Tax=Haloferacaceae TaxID=1644056 RepID=A0A6G1Z1N5_9EURY|nr:COX15/CtaA family protein [Haloferax sp. CBA1149]KAB1187772.1 heme A synthase [Haloferax sp. CBA1149]MRW80433.1 heme A synthase [Haloferax marinisediminis]
MTPRLRRLLAGAAAMTGVLMVLGVYTAASGAGLTCAGRWPFCDGFLGLFPANWGSFIEWFHRLVAMLTGFLILGTTVKAWREGVDPRVRWALVVATVILPFQIVLGALTVTEYEWVILTAHYVVATSIFTAVVAAAAWGLVDRGIPRIADAIRLALVGAPIMLVLAPHSFVSFGPLTQATYYLVGLATYAALVAATLWASAAHSTRADVYGRLRLITAPASVVVVALLIAGRQVYGPTLQLAHLGGTVVALVLVVAAAIVVRGGLPVPREAVTNDAD